jgi:hypothetical protein
MEQHAHSNYKQCITGALVLHTQPIAPRLAASAKDARVAYETQWQGGTTRRCMHGGVSSSSHQACSDRSVPYLLQRLLQALQ